MITETSNTPDHALIGQSLSVSLTVKDLQASRAWYSDVVGFKVEQEYERDGQVRAIAMSAGPVRLLINLDDGGKGWERVKGEGVSLMLTTAQDIDTIANGIKSRGGTLETEPADMPWGVRMFRLHDPDGFKVAISSPR